METATRHRHAVQRHVGDGTLHAQNGHVGERIGIFIHSATRGIQSLVRNGELVRIRDLDSGRLGRAKRERVHLDVERCVRRQTRAVIDI